MKRVLTENDLYRGLGVIVYCPKCISFLYIYIHVIIERTNELFGLHSE